MLSGTGLSGSDRDDKVSNRLDTSKEAVVSNKDVEKLGIPRSERFTAREFQSCPVLDVVFPPQSLFLSPYCSFIVSCIIGLALVIRPYHLSLHFLTMAKVQRRAARYACNNYTERTPGCVTAMVSSQGWESLQDRRKMHRLTMLYKIKHNLVEIPESESIVRSNNSRTRGAQRLFVPYTNITVYKMSFFPRTIQEWNKLPSTITAIQRIEAFKTALHASIAVQPPSTA